MKKTIWSLALLGTLGGIPAAYAADYLSADTASLTAKERKAIAMATEWSKGGTPPFMSGGKLTYVHGSGGVATVIAEPFQVCDVELEPGELVNEIVVGDSARWQVEEGVAGKSIHLFIKPRDVGLESSAVITTDRRVYHLRLVSKRGGYTPYIGFVYAGDLRKQVLARSTQAERAKKWSSTEDNEGKALDLSALNFGYEVDGKASWKPERVYDDGQKTLYPVTGLGPDRRDAGAVGQEGRQGCSRQLPGQGPDHAGRWPFSDHCPGGGRGW